MPTQTENGKSFEYALLCAYRKHLQGLGVCVNVEDNTALARARTFYERQAEEARIRFDAAAQATIPTLLKLEPGLTCADAPDDVLHLSLVADAEGQGGDVRDVIFRRADWELGFSAKNNNDAVKHSRLSQSLDFGKVWLQTPCSDAYFDEIRPIFERLAEERAKGRNWSELSGKDTEVYVPILHAFRKEMMLLAKREKEVPARLIRYLIGRHPFYKVIKDDGNNLVVVKAFNIAGGLNASAGGTKARFRTPKLNLPTRIVELDFKKSSTNTLQMILDGGWEISFRIHNASTRVEASLKFDIQLIGNPPVLFTQHLFQ